MQIVATSVRAFFVLTTFLFLFTTAKAQQPVQIESDAGVISMVATVEAVDVTNQVLTVSGPQNNWVTVKVTPEDIKRIKVRDRITISYSDEVAVALQKLHEAPQNQMVSEEESGMNMNDPTEAEQDWVEATPQGVTDLTTIEITDTVAAIDRFQRTITFAGSGGKTWTIKISPSVQGLDQINVGDVVALEVTRAVAVNIKPV
jgi:ribulose 1,5-bisphosphate synthetase/thiazole synthase